MRTIQLLLPALLAIGTVVTALPDPAEAAPKHRSAQFQAARYRPGHRARPTGVPELSVGAAAAALGLLGGGFMVITGRRRRDKRA